MPENPDYKIHAGNVLYEYVETIVGAKAPKVTGMLINLPIEHIKCMMQDFYLLRERLQEACLMLD